MNEETKDVIGTFAAIFIICVCVDPIIIYLLWNWLVHEAFAMPAITFPQSIGISILAAVLFRSWSIIPADRSQ